MYLRWFENYDILAMIIVIVITIIVILLYAVWNLFWKVKIAEKVASKRLEQSKKLIKEIEDHVDLKQFMQKENATLKAIVNSNPATQVAWIASLKPGNNGRFGGGIIKNA